jgi:hypothetical protein
MPGLLGLIRICERAYRNSKIFIGPYDLIVMIQGNLVLL